MLVDVWNVLLVDTVNVKNMKKLLIFGDIHGEDYWQREADIALIRNTPHIATDYDRYIFLGDYVDSFTQIKEEQIKQLRSLINFKLNYPKEVTLLLGNHDLYYYFNRDTKFACSGSNSTYTEIFLLFNHYKDLFEPVAIEDNYLFTHAGIHNYFTKDYETPKEIYEYITNQFNGFKDGTLRNSWIFQVGRLRGGYSYHGGIFWADKREFDLKHLPENIYQIVGHTPVKKPISLMGSNKGITFIDTHYYNESRVSYELLLN